MATIKFDKDTLDKVNIKSGVYSGLRKTDKESIEKRPVTMRIVEDAFRQYARAHKGCTTKMENDFWKQFKKYLDKELS